MKAEVVPCAGLHSESDFSCASSQRAKGCIVVIHSGVW
jgi:hypothetical protein